MVVRGRTRCNGRQLAAYVLAQGENEHIQILEAQGNRNANDNDVHQALLSMSLTAELSRSSKGLYHAQINPAYGEDAAMTPENWFMAADMMGHELNLQNQRRVIVLHTKKGRTHAHVIWERYDHAKNRMVSDSYSRLAQDRARQAMEQVFQHQRTPERNTSRPDMKKFLTQLWQRTTTAKEFITEAAKVGFIIAAGIQRRPFMVVDHTGRSFDLVRQLEGIKTKEVRTRLNGEKLIGEKQAIAAIRWTQEKSKPISNANRHHHKTAQAFSENKTETLHKATSVNSSKAKEVSQEFKESAHEATKDKRQSTVQAFAENRNDVTPKEEERERRKAELLEEIRKAFTQGNHHNFERER